MKHRTVAGFERADLLGAFDAKRPERGHLLYPKL